MGCRCCCIRRSPRSSSSRAGPHRKKRWLRPCADVASAHGGESHGRALVSMLEGMVAGVHVTSDDIRTQLARRRLGYGRGARMKFEADDVTVLAGVRHGVTLGGPIAVEIGNTEWPKWET